MHIEAMELEFDACQGGNKFQKARHQLCSRGTGIA